MTKVPLKSDSMFAERPIVYSVNGQSNVGIFHAGLKGASTGVLIVVGGRQYRVGAHRQFVSLARTISNAGFPVFRFDIRGTGDSAASVRHYLDTKEDLQIALETMKRQSSGIKKIIVWGLCDGATATIMNLGSLDTIHGVMLVNPWVSTDVGSAKVQMKHYYQRRLFGVHFWKKLFSGKLDIKTSVCSLLSTAKLAASSRNATNQIGTELPGLVFNNLKQFKGRKSIVISNADLTAMEFFEAYSERYKNSDDNLKLESLVRVDADHTFSGDGQHRNLEKITLDFVIACHEWKSD